VTEGSTTSVWKGPLAGLKVLDLTRVLSGPFATQILGDLGAEIIKVEPIKGDDTRSFQPRINGESHYFLSVNRSKKSIVVDLHTAEGRDIIRTLAARVDILVENYRPGVMKDMGLEYEALAKVNPGLIYCSISGFGQDGPLRDLPAFDIVTQALTGALSVNGAVGGPAVKLGLPMGDLVGGLFGAIGVLAALNERVHSGQGKLIDISLFDGLLGLLGYLPLLAFATGQNPQPYGSAHPNLVPYGAYPASNGEIIIACLTEPFWKKLCAALGMPELGDDTRFNSAATRLQRREEVDALISARTRQKTVSDWTTILRDQDVPHAPVLGIREALAQPHAVARAMIQKTVHPTAGNISLVGRPIKFPGNDQPPLAAPPVFGADTDDVLGRELDYSAHELAALRKRAVIV
jgi:crotonobetainyl-CoA:carnitine CoA-transferase CaiB-like acyl-CoA transferase